MSPKNKQPSAAELSFDVEKGKTTSRMSFVDYVPPPPRPLPPPAKYKLWFMVLVCVYFATWFSSEAGVVSAIQRTFRFSQNASVLILLILIVGTLVFSTLDLLVFACRIKIGGEWYGLGSWLKQPRNTWIHGYTNFFAKFLASVIHIFEDGFALFNAQEGEEKPKAKQFDFDDEEEVILRVENRIKPEKVEAYHAWREKFDKMGCTARPGLKNVETVEAPEGDVYVMYLTFTHVDMLNEYMQSPIHDRMVRNLQPLLVTPSLVQLRKSRKLPDAFTDLCTEQGKPIPKLLPKKWKVWTLTTMGLWFVVMVTRATLPFYYEQWGLDEAHPRAEALVTVTFNTFLNTYVATPFLTMLFGKWLKRKETEQDNDEPWRTLNDGLPSVWSKVLLTLAFYGGCVIAWAVKG